MRDVLIIDYGIGNILNVQRACEAAGGRVKVSSDPKDVVRADRVILPGVGAFGEGMRNIQNGGLDRAIHQYIGTGKPFFGVCVGMQLLLSESEELGRHKGLDLISGQVRGFPKPEGWVRNYKVPQIGWNTLQGSRWKGTVLEGLPEGTQMYFVHSFCCFPENSEVVIAKTRYHDVEFCSALTWKNIAACQFHPERSGSLGIQIYKNFLEWNP